MDTAENSQRDRFWVSVPDGREHVVGFNHFGMILTMLRDELRGTGAELPHLGLPTAIQPRRYTDLCETSCQRSSSKRNRGEEQNPEKDRKC